MCKFSREYLFKECVLHRHCILLRLKRGVKWYNDVVDEIFMVDMCLEDKAKKQILRNIANTIDTHGIIEIKAFIDQESPHDAKTIMVLTDDIMEIELIVE